MGIYVVKVSVVFISMRTTDMFRLTLTSAVSKVTLCNMVTPAFVVSIAVCTFKLVSSSSASVFDHTIVFCGTLARQKQNITTLP